MADVCKFCNQQDLRPFLDAFCCSLCRGIFCISHRNPEEHQCRILQQKEERRREINRKHEEIIDRLCLNVHSDNLSEENKQDEFIKEYDKVINGDNVIGGDVVINGDSISREHVIKGSDTFQRVKMRMKCDGDRTIPVYNRIHVRITLCDEIQRGDIQSTIMKKLPSQRRGNNNHASKSISDIYTWLDRTKSIGWHLDFIKRRFKLKTTNNEKELSKLFLCDKSNDLSVCNKTLPFECLVADYINDGDRNLRIEMKDVTAA